MRRGYARSRSALVLPCSAAFYPCLGCLEGFPSAEGRTWMDGMGVRRWLWRTTGEDTRVSGAR